MFENRVLRRICGPKRDEMSGVWKEDCMVRNFRTLLSGRCN
jgi:hypothetical protein